MRFQIFAVCRAFPEHSFIIHSGLITIKLASVHFIDSLFKLQTSSFAEHFCFFLSFSLTVYALFFPEVRSGITVLRILGKTISVKFA